MLSIPPLTGPAAIVLQIASKVEISNGYFTDTDFGIVALEVSGLYIHKTTFFNNYLTSITVIESISTTILNNNFVNTVFPQFFGIFLSGFVNIKISENDLFNANILLVKGGSGSVTGNTLSTDDSTTLFSLIQLGGTSAPEEGGVSSLEISSNKITSANPNSSCLAILCISGFGITIQNNTILSFGNSVFNGLIVLGIDFSSGEIIEGVVIKNNNLSGGAAAGIVINSGLDADGGLTGVMNTVVENNSISGFTTGIIVEGVGSNVTSNTLIGNSSGILVNPSAVAAVISTNLINYNGRGVYLGTGTTGILVYKNVLTTNDPRGGIINNGIGNSTLQNDTIF